MKWCSSGNGYYQKDTSAAVTFIEVSTLPPSYTAIELRLPLGANGHYGNSKARNLAATLQDNDLGQESRDFFKIEAPIGDSKLIKFLDIVNQHESIDYDVYSQILRRVGCIKEADIQYLKGLIDEKAFEKAIDYAKQQQDNNKHDAIWSLTTLLDQEFEANPKEDILEQLNKVCLLISEDNPSFKEANELLFNRNLNRTFESEDEKAAFLLAASVNSQNKILAQGRFDAMIGLGMGTDSTLGRDINICQNKIYVLKEFARWFKELYEKLGTLNKEIAEQKTITAVKRAALSTNYTLFNSVYNQRNNKPDPVVETPWFN